MKAITHTDFHFPGQRAKYTGKVRDVYFIDGKYILLVATDRISAFDVVLPKGIPCKGQVLNQIASRFLDATSDIVPNWKIAEVDPMATIGHLCEPFKVEMVIRGYLAGHAWREYCAGKRSLCGEPLPEGLKENQKLPRPIITPTTKASEGHDEDISREEIIASGLVSAEDYAQLEKYTLALYERAHVILVRGAVELVHLREQAFLRRPRAAAGRVELHYLLEDGDYLLLTLARNHHNVRDRADETPVGVQLAYQHLRKRQVFLVDVRHLELREQVLLKRLLLRLPVKEPLSPLVRILVPRYRGGRAELWLVVLF